MRKSLAAGALFSIVLPLAGGSALAQRATSDQSIVNLPRPGYEPKRIRLGQTVISPQLVAGVQYDDNVFADSTNKIDDYLVSISPTISVDRDDGKLRFGADLFGTWRDYLKNEDEAVTTFGFNADTRYTPSRAHTLSSKVNLQRSFERRGDPEADLSAQRAPAKINILHGELGYQYRPNRIGFSVRGMAEKLDYVPLADADRDVLTYRFAGRIAARVSPRLDVFVEGYVNKRDADTAVDRSGIDRDSTTKGALAGVAIDVADRLTGELGVGVFKVNPQDPALDGFSGFAANGSLSWRPRVRTAITADIFRGDVATIRSGANGRIDTRVNLRVDQEVRHNLLLSGGVGIGGTTYRGVTRSQTLHTAELETTFLVNRNIGITAGAIYSKRTANVAIDEFERWRLQLSTRFLY